MTIIIALIVAYVIGVLLVGYFAGRDAWRNGNADRWNRKEPHNHTYTWGSALGYGLLWPLLAVAMLIVGIIVGVSWPFTTDRARSLAAKLWGER